MFKLALTLVLLLLVAPQTLFTPSQQQTESRTPCQVSRFSGEEYLNGNVAVRRASNGNIVVIIDSANDSKKFDGRPDVVYRFAPLQADINRYSYVSFNLKQAQVLYQEGRLTVVAKDNHVMVSLSVEKTAEDDPWFSNYGDRSRDLPNTVRLSEGIGLIRQIPTLSDDAPKLAGIDKPAKISSLPTLIDLEADFVIHRGARPLEGDPDPGGSGCQAGGKGAISCGLNCPNNQGCSITCGLGYYACCNCGNCVCVEKGLID